MFINKGTTNPLQNMVSSFFLDFMIFLVIHFAEAQCPNGCVCTATEFSCSGLDAVPLADEISPTIETVSLTDGRISEIPPSYLVDFADLANLNLTNNNLTTLSIDSFSYLPRLEKIYLAGNPIVCDENIDWLRTWKRVFPPANDVDGTCDNSPVDLTTYLEDKPGQAIQIKFVNPDFKLSEDSGTVSIQFNRTGSTASDLNIKLVYSLSGVTEAEFVLPRSEVVVPAGQVGGNFNISLIDNDVVNDYKRQILLDFNPEPITALATNFRVTILDDEGLKSSPEPEPEPTLPPSSSPEPTTSSSPSVTMKTAVPHGSSLVPRLYIMLLAVGIIIVVIGGVVVALLYIIKHHSKQQRVSKEKDGTNATEPETLPLKESP